MSRVFAKKFEIYEKNLCYNLKNYSKALEMDKKSIQKESVCTYCGVGCDITGVVEDNRIVKVYAQKDGVVSQGKLCIKGKYGFDFVDSKERIDEALIRKSFVDKNSWVAEEFGDELRDFNREFFSSSYDVATSITAKKLQEITKKYSPKSFCAIGGARTNCESAYIFQKFCRESIGSPHVDNCARVCHSPSLRGMRETIGEGAATNPYNDIYESEFLLVIGSNTIEAHPIIANRVVDRARKENNLAVIDVRPTKLAKLARYNCIIPFETNLLILNAMAYVILDEELYDREFVATRTKNFEEFKEAILNDPYANPQFFNQITGYEYLAKMIPNIAREYAVKRSMILWGLGVTEHIDGSFAVMALTHLALLTGNIGKTGAGLMPLRGQNNVQGACDMGCLPYYAPDYKEPKEVGKMTPELIDGMLQGEIKALYNMGEDIAHIHPNQNKISKALDNLEFIVVQELFMSEIAKRADVVFGVKSAYEKEGVYINAMRRLHLSQPLVESNRLDDWEILQLVDKKMGGSFDYGNSEDVWDEVREVASERFSGAKYYRLKRHRKRGMQWPIFHEDTPILHLLDFRTEDGLGRFSYHQWQMRGVVKDIFSGDFDRFGKRFYYLTTGRTLAHYNNSSQTSRSRRLDTKYDEDVVLAPVEDREFLGERVVLKSPYGESEALRVNFIEGMKPNTLFCTFHHAKSRINHLFGDESDELVKTASFKSIKVEVVVVNGGIEFS